jgi:hypothetical protein
MGLQTSIWSRRNKDGLSLSRLIELAMNGGHLLPMHGVQYATL